MCQQIRSKLYLRNKPQAGRILAEFYLTTDAGLRKKLFPPLLSTYLFLLLTNNVNQKERK